MDLVNLELSKGLTPVPKKQYGVTPPISEAMATPQDYKLTENLIIAMRQENLYETVEGMKKREYVLASLNKLVREWIYEASLEHSMNEEEALSAGGGIFTFGSYRLGVVAAGSDIDTLCIAPRHISRESFFSFFLAKLQQDINVTKVQPVPDAYTPIIKMVYHGMEMDLLFACLNLSRIPNDLNTLDDDLLKNVDDKTARSLNGCRVNDMILQLVPNKESFRTALRFVKHWSKARGIYSNVLGYLGGISWAILTARICQLYPNAAPSQIINRFFYIYKTWQWKNPVILCEIKEVPKNTPGLMGFRVWNPNLNPQDRAHVMPIITPAFPSMNSTHNVTHTTLRVITDELQRAYQIIQDIENDKATWHDVWSPFLFFEKHKHFIQIKMLSNNEQAFHKWIGWIESKLRFLVRKLETFKGLQVRPWPKAIQEQDEAKDGFTFAQSMYIGLILNNSNSSNNSASTGVAGVSGTSDTSPVVDLRGAILDFVGFIMNWSEVENYKDSIDLKVRHLRAKDLPKHLREQSRANARAIKASINNNINANNSVKETPSSFISSQQSTSSSNKRARNEDELTNSITRDSSLNNNIKSQLNNSGSDLNNDSNSSVRTDSQCDDEFANISKKLKVLPLKTPSIISNDSETSSIENGNDKVKEFGDIGKNFSGIANSNSINGTTNINITQNQIKSVNCRQPFKLRINMSKKK
ncbi:pap2p poly A polymerase [Cryptosporidium sp. chipmunk genotype I]|uniref:pap2p poly A polymerase n=1 Tax=Cryptosporidium sp. chipmunk genotype I TaxID=1280935 RepID=UPI003519DDA3|nr:pap2p poly A polymerase [Cryptosporidium sp. chipmunk genotype I]